MPPSPTYTEEVVYPEVTVYQSAEQIPSFSNLSHKAESRFDKLQDEVAREYEKKGYSNKEAMKIGGAVAYDAGVKKYGKAGMERLAREGRRDKRGAESKFDKLSDKIAKQYEKKGMSAKKAKEIGKKTAYTIGARKYGKAGMARKARRGRRAESFGAESICSFQNCDEQTLMHMMGYGGSACEVGVVQEMIRDGRFDLPTMRYVVSYYERNWGGCDDEVFALLGMTDAYGAESFEAEDGYVIVDRGNYKVRVHKKNLDRFNRSTMHKIHSDKHKEGLMYDEETMRWIPLEAESFEAQGNPDKRTTTQYAKFYVGFEDDEGELRGGGKFKKYDDALAQADIVSEREGNSRIVTTRGFALWTDDGKGMWQDGYDKKVAKEFYSAEGYTIGSGFRLGFGLGLGMLALSTATTILAIAVSKVDERQVE